MLKALSLVLAPARTWEKIVRSKRGFWATLFGFLLPVMLVCSLAEGYALTRWGERRGIDNHLVTISREAVLRFEGAQLLFGLITVFLGAKILEWLAENFHLPARYTQAFTVVAYGYSPLFLVRLLDGYPAFSSWAWWAVGVVAVLHVLYYGVGLVLQPDQTKGFGLYLMCILTLILLGGPAHLLARAILDGKIAL